MGKFNIGDTVEVMSEEIDLLGSYWEASVVAKHSLDNEYIIEYKTLLEEDSTGPLREVVREYQLRPIPPDMAVERYRFGDRVDAFNIDGWWSGTIVGTNVKEGQYYVYFDYLEGGLFHGVTTLRMHQDWNWMNATWFLPCHTPQLGVYSWDVKA